MFPIKGFPQLVIRLGIAVLLFHDLAKPLGESTVEIGMPNHVPRMRSSYFDVRNATVRSYAKTPLVSYSLRPLSSIVGTPYVPFEGILLKIVVTRAHIRIAKKLAHQPERLVVVAVHEVTIHDNFHIELILQIVEGFLLVPYHHNDVTNARLAQLPYLPLNQYLATYPKQSLWSFIGDGDEARGKPSCHDDSIVDGVRLERCHAVRGESSILNESGFSTLAYGYVHDGKPKSGSIGELLLSQPRSLRKDVYDLELIISESHSYLYS